MSGELEAAGAVVDAGLVAGAIEGAEPGKPGEGPCLNCGAQLSGGRFCANCGQAAHANRSLWALIEELAWNVFNLDTKAWRTLPRLAFRPGTLTRSYIDGKRARYLSPLATFLLCFFLMFFVFSLVPKPQTLNLGSRDSVVEVSDSRDNPAAAEARLAEAQKRLDDARREAGPHPSLLQQAALDASEQVVASARARLQQQRAAAHTPGVSVTTNDDPSSQPGAVNLHFQTGGSAPAAPVAPAAPATASTPPQPPATGNLDPSRGPVTLDDLLRRIAQENITVDGRRLLSAGARAQLANPPLFYNHLQDAASRWGFLLVPISLPFIALLFLFKKNLTLYDHTVFALNSLSFASLLFALVLATSQVPALHFVQGASFLFVLPIHTFFHVGGAYQIKWWSALWRTLFMLFFAFIALIIFFIAVLFIGLAG